ncbi:MAG: M57 family metalloprotease [Proteobacteria bacterium]|nr:M57 family metalloprotease [Pseudomonadota bacterium]
MELEGPGAEDTEYDIGTNREWISFEEFVANTYKEPDQDGGVWVLDGDTPVETLDELYEYYELLYFSDGALAVHRNRGRDSKWSNSTKKNLTYCISNNFGSRKNSVKNAMSTATRNWENAANVDFKYRSSQDGNCTGSNGSVVFDVRYVSGKGYLARAFFPHQSRRTRNILIDASVWRQSTYSVAGILRHELGHALGFRHEHTRPQGPSSCFEDNNWRGLTSYDRNSVMHYPQCGGSNSRLSYLSSKDKSGARSLYGAP